MPCTYPVNRRTHSEWKESPWSRGLRRPPVPQCPSCSATSCLTALSPSVLNSVKHAPTTEQGRLYKPWHQIMKGIHNRMPTNHKRKQQQHTIQLIKRNASGLNLSLNLTGAERWLEEEDSTVLHRFLKELQYLYHCNIPPPAVDHVGATAVRR